MINGRGNENTLNLNTSIFDKEALDRLKNIQSLIKRGWQGLDVKVIGQPGYASIVNKKYKKLEATEE